MKKTLGFGLGLILLAAGAARAVAPDPALVARLKNEGKWAQFEILYKSWKDKLGYPNPHPYRARFSFYPNVNAPQVVRDTIKVVVIYAAPSDRPISADGLTVTRDQLQAILFGPNPTGSMTDYYKEISYGRTVVTGTVFGPYTLPQTNQYYTNNSYGLGAYPNNAQKFVEDAVAAADPDVDFRQFDANGDGAVDGLFVVHSGPGAEQTGRPSDIWSHAYVFSSPQRDGKILGHYSIEPELQPGPTPIQIGVFCHEGGHSLFGLPDLYDTDYSSEGVGVWDLMGSGNYQNGSRTPVHMSAWCKKKVGWLAPVNLTSNQVGVAIPTVQYSPVVYRLWTHGNVGLEYFLVENRSRRGFDSFLPAGGLLIWHIDESVSDNNVESRYMVGLEQADGLNHLGLGLNRGDAGDPFPGSTDNTTFNETSNPNSLSNTLQPTQVAATNISAGDSVKTADLQVIYPQPYIGLGREGFIFTGIYKGALPAAKNLVVSNTGGRTLNWRAGWNRSAGWLSVTPDSGTAPDTPAVQISSTNLLPGIYTDTISITSPDAPNSPQKAWVSYQVSSIRGDMNHDGILFTADIVALVNCVFLNPSDPSCDLLVADIDCNGYLSPPDVVILLREVFLNWTPPC